MYPLFPISPYQNCISSSLNLYTSHSILPRFLTSITGCSQAHISGSSAQCQHSRNKEREGGQRTKESVEFENISFGPIQLKCIWNEVGVESIHFNNKECFVPFYSIVTPERKGERTCLFYFPDHQSLNKVLWTRKY